MRSRMAGLCLVVLVLVLRGPSASTAATISISPSSASVPVADIQQFTATTDPTGPVSWSVQITYHTGCPQHCVFHHSICIGCLEVPGKRCSQKSDSK